MSRTIQWTEEQVELVKNNEFMSVEKLAIEFGVSRKVVERLKERIKEGRPINIGVSEEAKSFILKKLKEEMLHTEIVKLLDSELNVKISKATVSYIAKTNGFAKRLYRERDALIEKYNEKEEEIAQIRLKAECIKRNLKPGDKFVTKSIKYENKMWSVRRNLVADKIYPNFVLTTDKQSISYYEIDGIYRA